MARSRADLNPFEALIGSYRQASLIPSWASVSVG